LSKPSAVSVPLIAGAIDYFLLRRASRKVWASILPLLLLTIPFIIIGRVVQTTPHVTNAPPWTRPLVALDALAFYACKIAWPATLGIIYGRTPEGILKSGQIYYTWVLPVMLFAIGYATRKKWPALITGESTVLFALLPVLGLTPFMFQVHSTVADHYVYVAMLGVALIVTGAIRSAPRMAVYVVASVVVVVMAARSFVQAGTWHDSIALATHAINVTPTSGTAHSNLGVALAEANRIGEAVEQLQIAVKLEPGNRDAHTRLAQAYFQTERFADAYEQAQIAIELIESGPANTIERADRARLIRELALRQLARQERQPPPATTRASQP
jgi:tetratricopeptide (TPR) repeat protein